MTSVRTISQYPVHHACQGEEPPERDEVWLILEKN